MTFFDISPVGRILNRISSDAYTIDDRLPFMMNILLSASLGLCGKYQPLNIVVSTFSENSVKTDA